MNRDGTSMVRPENSCSSTLSLPPVAQRYHCRPPLKSGPVVLRTIHCEFFVGQRGPTLSHPEALIQATRCRSTPSAGTLRRGCGATRGTPGDSGGGHAREGAKRAFKLPIRIRSGLKDSRWGRLTWNPTSSPNARPSSSASGIGPQAHKNLTTRISRIIPCWRHLDDLPAH